MNLKVEMSSVDETASDLSGIDLSEDDNFFEMVQNDNPELEYLSKHLEFIAASEECGVFVGASDLVGSFWTGDLYYYSNPIDVTCLEHYAAKLFFECGICDGKFLSNSGRIIVGDDFGSLSIYRIRMDEVDFQYVFYPEVQQNGHRNMLSSMSVSTNATRVVSGGWDQTLVVWSADQLNKEYVYNLAHERCITCVSFARDNEHVFASSSLDGYGLMWDVRDSIPATVLLKDNSLGVNAIEWIPNSNNVALGYTDGTVSFVDIRKPKCVLKSGKFFDRGIFRFSAHPLENYLAVCADNRVVKVMNHQNEELPLIYSDERHTRFVRGLTWAKGNSDNYYLLTSGFDGRVYEHFVNE